VISMMRDMSSGLLLYDRGELQSLCTTTLPATAVMNQVRLLGLWANRDNLMNVHGHNRPNIYNHKPLWLVVVNIRSPLLGCLKNIEESLSWCSGGSFTSVSTCTTSSW